jgi:hypothetical protein
LNNLRLYCCKTNGHLHSCGSLLFILALASVTLTDYMRPVKDGGVASAVDALDFRSWHIASFRYPAKFGRDRGIADIDQSAPIFCSAYERVARVEQRSCAGSP